MCQQILQFCNNSAKPLLFVGSSFSLLLACGMGYLGWASNSLFNLIDTNVARSMSVVYFLQLAACGYMILVAALSCYAAQYDQKHSIRALSVISSINCILALAAILMIPSGADVSGKFRDTLMSAKEHYDFTEGFPPPNQTYTTLSSIMVDNGTSGGSIERAANGTRIKRAVSIETDAHKSTCLWDQLQERGCCGFDAPNITWTKGHFPKSCCDRTSVKENEKDNKKEFICESVDSEHQMGCQNLIAKTTTTLSIFLIIVALVNLYLAVVSGISTYKTFHYSEASQSAYT